MTFTVCPTDKPGDPAGISIMQLHPIMEESEPEEWTCVPPSGR